MTERREESVILIQFIRLFMHISASLFNKKSWRIHFVTFDFLNGSLFE